MRFKTVLFLLTWLTVHAFGQGNDAINAYKIESKDLTYKPTKASFDVRIEKRITRDEIKKVANKIMDDYPGFKTYFIFYWLPDMKIGTGAWATSHFNENFLSVNIQGVSAAEEQKMKTTAIPDGEIVGKWYDSRPYAESTIIFYQKNNVIKAREIYKDGSFGDKDLRKTGTKYIYPNDFGEFFKIENDGNLGLYSSNGRFAVAVKIK